MNELYLIRTVDITANGKTSQYMYSNKADRKFAKKSDNRR